MNSLQRRPAAATAAAHQTATASCLSSSAISLQQHVQVTQHVEHTNIPRKTHPQHSTLQTTWNVPAAASHVTTSVCKWQQCSPATPSFSPSVVLLQHHKHQPPTESQRIAPARLERAPQERTPGTSLSYGTVVVGVGALLSSR
ncbi:hypothetical protein GN958_ATG16271 [Phytophthora infestans]|uniref:Uncharacterized protein n=1 Tax=Phytophthora infestans TaxID=4787 RepID=A0A8S9U1Q2_PHYIN|nr:hypothetical protein GN958_ATG19215 [Phytophthora infestans]KAF4134520.1 hypothetical protein GN958_ATG16271 [Phytophthora infestans]